ncbi:hypothetical protein D7S86_19105 [Pararobbsia silviterrae]|uniref:Uncharacterized protein n=1 Tax=Pararobbsia silviterrae TaxID=1792498 RepID=A0A494XI67_9BURK|nr:hypothetical protein D7S86_19105 [Pararobbsia silviterrae]
MTIDSVADHPKPPAPIPAPRGPSTRLALALRDLLPARGQTLVRHAAPRKVRDARRGRPPTRVKRPKRR